MRACEKCGSIIKNRWTNPKTGKIHIMASRKFCLTCSPFGLHNTRKITKITGIFRKCPRCHIDKDISEFYSRRDRAGNSAYCRSCSNAESYARHKRLKTDAVMYKGGKCQTCGYSKCLGALEFHHRDPTQKEFALSCSKARTLEALKSELDKCDLLCSNCHREIHYKL